MGRDNLGKVVSLVEEKGFSIIAQPVARMVNLRLDWKVRLPAVIATLWHEVNTNTLYNFKALNRTSCPSSTRIL